MKAQAALMYDAVFVLVEAFNKLLRKKPDQFRSDTMRNRMGQLVAPVTNVSTANTTNNANVNRVLDCNTSKGNVIILFVCLICVLIFCFYYVECVNFQDG